MFSTVAESVEPEIYNVLQPLATLVTGGLSEFADMRGISDSNPGLYIRNDSGPGVRVLSRAGSTTTIDVDNRTVTIGTNTSDTLTVEATTAYNGPVTFGGTTTVNGTFSTTSTTNLGNGNADAITVIGVTTFRNAVIPSATQLTVDAGNDRVLVGTGTALTGATSSKLEVTGRVYLTPVSASEDLLTLWHSPSAGSGWTIGVTTTPNGLLKFKDDGGQGIVTFGDTASTYQLEVTGDGHFTDDCYVDGDLTAGRVAVGATSWSGSEELRVVGQSRFEGDITATTGTFDFQNSGNSRLKIDSTGIGFFGSTPIAKPTVTGSRGGNAALQDLLSELANLGLIIDLSS